MFTLEQPRHQKHMHPLQYCNARARRGSICKRLAAELQNAKQFAGLIFLAGRGGVIQQREAWKPSSDLEIFVGARYGEKSDLPWELFRSRPSLDLLRPTASIQTVSHNPFFFFPDHLASHGRGSARLFEAKPALNDPGHEKQLILERASTVPSAAKTRKPLWHRRRR